MNWWEKTVEYLFIRDHVCEDHMLSPLDGTHERAGDALFAADNKWILLEFKRDLGSIRDEERKFLDFDEARCTLYGRDGHHLIVFGYNGDGKLALGGRTYFSDRSFKISDYLDHGVGY